MAKQEDTQQRGKICYSADACLRMLLTHINDFSTPTTAVDDALLWWQKRLIQKGFE